MVGIEHAVYLRDFRFDPTSCRLRHPDDGEVSLRPKTAAVLTVLVARAHEVVPKQDLLHEVWPGGFVGDNALSVCINELRQAFGDDAREPRFIATVHRRGYRLVADVLVLPLVPRMRDPDGRGEIAQPSGTPGRVTAPEPLGSLAEEDRRERDRSQDGRLDEGERAELARLRRENAELRTRCDVLKRSLALWVDEAMGR